MVSFRQECGVFVAFIITEDGESRYCANPIKKRRRCGDICEKLETVLKRERRLRRGALPSGLGFLEKAEDRPGGRPVHAPGKGGFSAGIFPPIFPKSLAKPGRL